MEEEEEEKEELNEEKEEEEEEGLGKEGGGEGNLGMSKNILPRTTRKIPRNRSANQPGSLPHS